MTTLTDAFTAAVDAVIAASPNNLNKNGFRNAMRTVLVSNITNAEVTAWIDAMVIFYEENGIINNATYSSFRSELINEGAVVAMRLFDNFAVGVNGLPESVPLLQAAELIGLRDDRDETDNAIDRIDVLIAAEPSGTVGRLVKDVLREGKRTLREYKQAIRDQIQNITDDPDST